MDYLGKTIWQIAKFGQLFMDQRLQRYSIGSGQHRILMCLYHVNGISQEEISHYLGVDKAATAKSLQKLEEQGYVKRSQHDTDGRKKTVSLTPKADAVRKELQALYEEWQSVLYQGFGSAEKSNLEKALGRILENAAAALPDGHIL
jgi:DNA-binding MarR family transcriptional regulator